MWHGHDEFVLEQDIGTSQRVSGRRGSAPEGDPGLCLLSEHGIREMADSFLDALINAIPNPVVVKDDKHRFIAVNAAVCAFLGRTSAQILGKTDYAFFGPRTPASTRRPTPACWRKARWSSTSIPMLWMAPPDGCMCARPD